MMPVSARDKQSRDVAFGCAGNSISYRHYGSSSVRCGPDADPQNDGEAPSSQHCQASHSPAGGPRGAHKFALAQAATALLADGTKTA
jgi:hypothetical protein